MADAITSTLNRDFDRWDKEVTKIREEIKRIELRRRQENQAWDREVDMLERKEQIAEGRKQDIRRQIEKRTQELERAQAKAANDNKPPQRSSSIW